jgi:rod shape-determining protein MreD
MKKFLLPLFLVAFALLQGTLLDLFKIFNVKPDLLLISSVIASLYFPFGLALAISLFSGMLKDALGTSAFGVNTLLFPLWTLLIFKLNNQIPLDFFPIRLFLMFVVSLFQAVASGLILISMGSFIPAGIFSRIVFVQAVYSALLFPALLKLYSLILQENG